MTSDRTGNPARGSHDSSPIELRVLGAVALRDHDSRDVAEVLAQPKRLALLLYLVLARPLRLHRRDALTGIFWPDLDQAHARGALRKSLQFLRRSLGARTIVGRGDDEIGVNPEALSCDALRFAVAIESGRYESALDLYQGALLEGFHTSGVHEFETWLDRERDWIRETAVRAAGKLADQRSAEGAHEDAARYARLAMDLAPYDERVVRRLIETLGRAGDRAGAIGAYRSFSHRLATELELEPTPGLQALVKSVTGRDHERRVTGGATGRSVRSLSLYREGQRLLGQLTEEDLRASIVVFREVIASDPEFALPYLGLARAYAMLGIAHGGSDPREVFPLVRESVERALARDDGLADAYALLGGYELDFGWNWGEAERSFRRALELDPASAFAHQRFAFLLSYLGRFREARRASSCAIELRPEDPLAWGDAGVQEILAGQYDAAIALLERGLELASDLHPLLWAMGAACIEIGQSERAIEKLERADRLSGHQMLFRGYLGYAYGIAGDDQRARSLLEGLAGGRAVASSAGKAAGASALVHIGLSESDAAFASLDVARERRSSPLPFLLKSPPGRRLHADQRYTEQLRIIGLPALGLH
jgi:DNA-binding SARP family transcriptional activator